MSDRPTTQSGESVGATPKGRPLDDAPISGRSASAAHEEILRDPEAVFADLRRLVAEMQRGKLRVGIGIVRPILEEGWYE